MCLLTSSGVQAGCLLRLNCQAFAESSFSLSLQHFFHGWKCKQEDIRVHRRLSFGVAVFEPFLYFQY